MSLEIIAQHLAKKGRGPDTLLVHMAPSEVAGLQSLAQAGGGSLTVNPDTGLPEAGFLSDLLPSIIGFGVSALSGGTLSPLMIGAGVGGLTALTSGGDLGKGVMAGLGAYGGANLGGGLMSLGTGAMQQQAGAAAAQGLEGLAADQAAQQAIAPQIAQASGFDRMAAGAQYAMNNPSAALAGMGGASGLGKNVLMAAAPAVGAMEPTTPMPGSQSSPALFRKMRMNPDGSFTEIGSTPMKEYGSTPFERFAEGGDVGGSADRDNFYNQPIYDTPKNSNSGKGLPPITTMPEDKTGQSPSDRAMDYLMGKTSSLKPYWTPQKPTVVEKEKPPVVEVVKPPPVIEPPQAGGQDFGGVSNAPGGGYGIPGATNINGVSGPTTGLASLANSAAATLGNWGLTGLSDAIAKNVDPNYSHEGNASQNAPNVDSQAALSDAMSNAISGAADTGSSGGTGSGDGNSGFSGGFSGSSFGGAHGTDGVGREGSSVSGGPSGAGGPSGGGGYGEGPGGGGGGGGGYDGGDPGGSGPRANGGIVGRYYNGGLASLRMADGGVAGYAEGGYSLGGYSDGGRLLRGPGSGVSDDIPATIGAAKQPARLADGEFVLPARIVSELGNGSTEAGARALYAMMDRIQKNRRKTVGKGKVAVNSKSTRLLPA